MNAGVPLETPLGTQLDTIPFDLVDHTDPHFAVVTDPSVQNGVTYQGLSLGEILEGTPGYPVELPPVGGDTGYFLVSTVPAGADVYLEDISGTRYLQGNTGAGPLNVTIMLTATPMKQIVANLSGYREAVHTITQYPAKGQTVPVGLTLQPAAAARRTSRTRSPAGSRPRTTTSAARASRTTTPRPATPAARTGTTTSTSRPPAAITERRLDPRRRVPDLHRERHPRPGPTWSRSASRPRTAAGPWTSPSTAAGRSRPGSRPPGRSTTYATASLGSTPCPNSGSRPRRPRRRRPPGREPADPVPLSAGTHTVQLVFHGDGQNLDWFELAPVPRRRRPTARRASRTSSHAVPGRVEAEDYDTAASVASRTPLRPTRAARTATTRSTSSAGAGTTTSAGPARASTSTYSVDANSAEQLPHAFRVANPGPAKTVTVRVNGVAETLTVPSTGSFCSWQTATLFAGWLPAGRNTVRVEMGTASSINLDYMQFTVGETQPRRPRRHADAGGAGPRSSPRPSAAPKGSAVKFTVTPASGKASGPPGGRSTRLPT